MPYYWSTNMSHFESVIVLSDGFAILKSRLRQFYNRFPYNASIRSIQRFMEAFVLSYNFITVKWLSWHHRLHEYC